MKETIALYHRVTITTLRTATRCTDVLLTSTHAFHELASKHRLFSGSPLPDTGGNWCSLVGQSVNRSVGRVVDLSTSWSVWWQVGFLAKKQSAELGYWVVSDVVETVLASERGGFHVQKQRDINHVHVVDGFTRNKGI